MFATSFFTFTNGEGSYLAVRSDPPVIPTIFGTHTGYLDCGELSDHIAARNRLRLDAYLLGRSEHALQPGGHEAAVPRACHLHLAARSVCHVVVCEQSSRRDRVRYEHRVDQGERDNHW